MKKIVKVGIISKEDYKNRTIAIAKGLYKPKKDEPKIWFESLNSMSQVLGSDNQELLKLIIKHKPGSLSELGKLSKRSNSNLSRTLKTLERYGIVDLSKKEGRLVPKVNATDFDVRFGIHFSRPVGDEVGGVVA